MTELNCLYLTPSYEENILPLINDAVDFVDTTQEPITLKLKSGDVQVHPGQSIQSITAACRKMAESNGTLSDLQISHQLGEINYIKHADSVQRLDFNNLTEILEWFTKLYEFQDRVLITDSECSDFIAQTFKEHGHDPVSLDDFNSATEEELGEKAYAELLIGVLIYKVDNGFLDWPFMNGVFREFMKKL